MVLSRTVFVFIQTILDLAGVTFFRGIESSMIHQDINTYIYTFQVTKFQKQINIRLRIIMKIQRILIYAIYHFTGPLPYAQIYWLKWASLQY